MIFAMQDEVELQQRQRGKLTKIFFLRFFKDMQSSKSIIMLLKKSFIHKILTFRKFSKYFNISVNYYHSYNAICRRGGFLKGL